MKIILLKKIFCYSLLLSVLIFLTNCGKSADPDLYSTNVQFQGAVDFDTSGITPAPSFKFNSINRTLSKTAVNINNSTVLARNISTGDTYTAAITNNRFVMTIPAGNYEFFAKNAIGKTMRMIKTGITYNNTSDTINIKSTTIAYMVYNSKINNGLATALNQIYNLSTLVSEAALAYDSAVTFLKTDINDTSIATYSRRQTAFLALAIRKNVLDCLNADSDLTSDTIISDTSVSLKFQAVINDIVTTSNDTIYLTPGVKFYIGNTNPSNIKITGLYEATTQTVRDYNLQNNQLIVLTEQGTYFRGDQISIFNASQFETPTLNAYTDVYNFADDNIIKSFAGKIFIINRTLSKILILNGSSLKLEKEYNLTGSNPHDIAFINQSKAFVTFYGSDYIAIINPMTGTQTDTINIRQFNAHNDAAADADQMQIVGDKVFITIQNQYNWSSINPKIIVVNANTNAIIDTININGLTNPNENKDYCEATGKLYFAFTGNWYDSEATGILEVDSVTHQTRVLCIGGQNNTDTMIDGAFTGVKVISADTGYCIYSGTWPNYYIASFNPTTGRFYNKNLISGSFAGDLIKDNANNVYALNRDMNYTNSGVYKINSNGAYSLSKINTATSGVRRNPVVAALFSN